MKFISTHVQMISLLIIAGVAAGCAASRDIDRIVQSTGGFNLERISQEGMGVDCIPVPGATADLIGEYDPDRCQVAEYSRGNASYEATFLSFESDNGAVGVYSLMSPDDAEPVNIGYEGSRTGAMVFFTKGNYMVSVTPEQNGAINGAEDLARELSSRIRRGIGLGPFASLVTDNLVDGSRLYFMGPLGLGTRYPRNFVEALMVNRDVEGVAAEYQVEMWRVNYLQINYPDHVMAREAMNNYLRSFSGGPLVYPDEMLQYYTIVVPDESEVYIAQYDNTVYLMLGNPQGGQTKQFFEYILRSANETTPNV